MGIVLIVVGTGRRDFLEANLLAGPKGSAQFELITAFIHDSNFLPISFYKNIDKFLISNLT